MCLRACVLCVFGCFWVLVNISVCDWVSLSVSVCLSVYVIMFFDVFQCVSVSLSECVIVCHYGRVCVSFVMSVFLCVCLCVPVCVSMCVF